MQPELEPPSAILDVLPRSAYILSSLDIILPTKSPANLDNATWFSTTQPNANFDIIRMLLIPPDRILSNLVAQLPTALKGE